MNYTSYLFHSFINNNANESLKRNCIYCYPENRIKLPLNLSYALKENLSIT